MSRSEPFHQHLYHWYLEHERTEELLQLQTHFIEAFLRNLSKTVPQYRDLLWRWYLGHNQYAKAAKVQYHIAVQEPNLTIQERIDMLGLASANAQAASAEYEGASCLPPELASEQRLLTCSDEQRARVARRPQARSDSGRVLRDSQRTRATPYQRQGAVRVGALDLATPESTSFLGCRQPICAWPETD